MKPLPLSSEDLVKELDELIPERCPKPSQSDRDIWMYVGMRSVVTSLLKRMEVPNTSTSITQTINRRT